MFKEDKLHWAAWPTKRKLITFSTYLTGRPADTFDKIWPMVHSMMRWFGIFPSLKPQIFKHCLYCFQIRYTSKLLVQKRKSTESPCQQPELEGCIYAWMFSINALNSLKITGTISTLSIFIYLVKLNASTPNFNDISKCHKHFL